MVASDTPDTVANDPDFLKNPGNWDGTVTPPGLAYVEERVDVSDLKVGVIEEWTIQDNHKLSGGSTEGHPFHLHAVSFEVIKRNGAAVSREEITIQDTVWVPHMESVTIRLRFRENAVGKAVMHCHILPHEDSGMMLNTLVSL